MYLATPIEANQQCLECHSRPAVAPPAMLASYGSDNGFGWKPGSIVAAQIVSVPMSLAVENARKAFRVLLICLVIALIATIVCAGCGSLLHRDSAAEAGVGYGGSR